MTDDEHNPILATALGIMNTAVPGMFDDPVRAWREFVPRLRYVVIAKTESPTLEQLKALQAYSTNFCNVEAGNLVAIKKAITQGEIRLEPTPKELAELGQQQLAWTGLHITLVPLTEEEQSEKLNILEL